MNESMNESMNEKTVMFDKTIRAILVLIYLEDNSTGTFDLSRFVLSDG
jgi:hypothetical protein